MRSLQTRQTKLDGALVPRISTPATHKFKGRKVQGKHPKKQNATLTDGGFRYVFAACYRIAGRPVTPDNRTYTIQSIRLQVFCKHHQAEMRDLLGHLTPPKKALETRMTSKRKAPPPATP